MAKAKPVPATKKAVRTKHATESATIQWEKYGLWIALAVITCTFWLLYYKIFDHKPDMNGDNFAYFLLGKRFVAGLGFTDATSRVLRPHIHFSPGYPAMIAVFIKLLGDSQDTIVLMNGVMMYLSCILMFFITRRLTGSLLVGFVVAFLCAVNSYLLRFSTVTMSEVPFLFISTLAIFTFIKAVDDPRSWKSPWLYLSIALMAYSYYIKSNAIAFLGGVALYFLFMKDWKRTLIAVTLFIALIFPWYLRTKRVGSSYIAQMSYINPYKPELGKIDASTMVDRVKTNIVRYVTRDIPLNIFPEGANAEKASTGYILLGILIVGLMVYGLYRLRDLRLLILAYLGGSLLILMVWPTEYGFVRYATPFTPLVLLLCLSGIQGLAALAIGEDRAPFAALPFLLIAFVYADNINQQELDAQQPLPPNYENYFAIARWAKENTPKDATFSARKPDMFIYYSDRLCVGDKPSLDDKEVLQFFRDNQVDYVIIEQLGFASTGKFLVPAVQKNMDKFEIVYQLKNPDTYLLKFKR